MSNERRIVRGGFRATVALLISIIALILAIMAYERTGGKDNLNAQIKGLTTKIEEMKRETARRVEDMREETASALERIGKAIKKD